LGVFNLISKFQTAAQKEFKMNSKPLEMPHRHCQIGHGV
jgi:hypothetical protein